MDACTLKALPGSWEVKKEESGLIRLEAPTKREYVPRERSADKNKRKTKMTNSKKTMNHGDQTSGGSGRARKENTMTSLKSMILDGQRRGTRTPDETRITEETLAALKSPDTIFVDAEPVHDKLTQLLDTHPNHVDMPPCLRPPFTTMWLEAQRPTQPAQRIGALIQTKVHKDRPPLRSLAASYLAKRDRNLNANGWPQELLNQPVTVEVSISVWYDVGGAAVLGDDQLAFLDYYGKYIASLGSRRTYDSTETGLRPAQVIAQDNFLWVFYTLASFHPKMNSAIPIQWPKVEPARRRKRGKAMKDFSNEETKTMQVLTNLVGKRLTNIFPHEGALVLEFDHAYRLQLSPHGCELRRRHDVPSLARNGKNGREPQ
jgi:hypothetical protein